MPGRDPVGARRRFRSGVTARAASAAATCASTPRVSWGPIEASTFEVRTGVPWRETLRGWDGPILHLTMYGEPLDDVLPRIPRSANLLLVVGAEKVPRAVFDLATFNVAVGNQPHSEVAALAVFLDRLLGGEGVRRAFRGRMRVVPSKRGKKVEIDRA